MESRDSKRNEAPIRQGDCYCHLLMRNSIFNLKKYMYWFTLQHEVEQCRKEHPFLIDVSEDEEGKDVPPTYIRTPKQTVRRGDDEGRVKREWTGFRFVLFCPKKGTVHMQGFGDKNVSYWQDKTGIVWVGELSNRTISLDTWSCL